MLRNVHATWIYLVVGTSFFSSTIGQSVCGSEPTQVIYLHTEFIPYEHSIERQMSYRLMRELARQSFVVAAQEELGAVVRDGTLHETEPESDQVVHLAVLERSNKDKTCHVKLFVVEDPTKHRPASGLWTSKPVWEKSYKYRYGGSRRYAQLTKMYEKASRTDFVEALQAAGIRQHGLRSGEKPSQTELKRWDKALLEVDFATQYGVLRDVHRSVRESGETVAHLERLCRGYANLSMLTQHQWNTTSEVFAARSWIYGRRLLNESDDRNRARAHLAYAFAIPGAHQHAIETIKVMRNADLMDNPASDEQWMRLIQPYVNCDRVAVKQVGVEAKSLKPWALFLSFQLAAAYRIPEWIKSAGDEALEAAPAAYGVYAMMAHRGGYGSIERYGADMAPTAMGKNIHSSLGSVIGIPKTVTIRPGLSGRDDDELLQADAGDQTPESIPKLAASQLRLHSAADAETNLSWSVLATLLGDEQFGQTANQLLQTVTVIEHSNDERIDAAMALVEGHRYANFIDSLRYRKSTEWDKIKKTLVNLRIEDPRPNMRYLPDLMYRIDSEQGIAKDPWRWPARNFTMQGLLERVRSTTKLPEGNRTIAKELRGVAPNHEMAIRLTIGITETPDAAMLVEWEKGLKEDPIAFRMIGRHYEILEDQESAIRCYERSFECLPTLGTVMAMAHHYRRNGQLDLWEQTLVDFLKTESYEFDHGSVRRQLVDGLIQQDRWRDAKQFAFNAAETFPSGSMASASFVLEGLGDWEASEHWIRSFSEANPTYRGADWYEWCRRTGRGNLAAARLLARRHYDAPKYANSAPTGLYHFMENQKELATSIFQLLHENDPNDKHAFMLHQLHLQQEHDQQALKTLGFLKQRIEERSEASRIALESGLRPKYIQSTKNKQLLEEIMQTGVLPSEAWFEEPKTVDPWDSISLSIIKLIETKKTNSDDIQALDQQIAELYLPDRAAAWYILASSLSGAGQQETAIEFWNKSLAITEPDLAYATLSGWELSKINTTSRPDNSSRDCNDQ